MSEENKSALVDNSETSTSEASKFNPIAFGDSFNNVETESTEPETQESVVNPVQATTNAAPVNTTQTQTTQVETTPVETTPAPTQTTQVPVNAQPEEETSA